MLFGQVAANEVLTLKHTLVPMHLSFNHRHTHVFPPIRPQVTTLLSKAKELSGAPTVSAEQLEAAKAAVAKQGDAVKEAKAVRTCGWGGTLMA